VRMLIEATWKPFRIFASEIGPLVWPELWTPTLPWVDDVLVLLGLEVPTLTYEDEPDHASLHVNPESWSRRVLLEHPEETSRALLLINDSHQLPIAKRRPSLSVRVMGALGLDSHVISFSICRVSRSERPATA
jgi:hypothetical protein